ncbi:hypothetical protein ABXS75_07255 [Roseburia hominis]
MDQIVPALETTLFDPSLSDACGDLIELGIDSLLDDGVAKSIPIVGLLVGVGKTAQNIHDRNLLKQTLRFIDAFNKKKIPQEKIEKYKRKLQDKPKYAEEELGRVIVLLNSNVDIKRSELLGKFYKAYVAEQITWEDFCELSDVISRMFISDLELLYKINSGEVRNTTTCKVYRVDRLIALGLVDSAVMSMQIGSAGQSKTERHVMANELGKIFCELCV